MPKTRKTKGKDGIDWSLPRRPRDPLDKLFGPDKVPSVRVRKKHPSPWRVKAYTTGTRLSKLVQIVDRRGRVVCTIPTHRLRNDASRINTATNICRVMNAFFKRGTL